MNPDRWRRIDSLYHAALELDRGERGAFLQQACRGDPAILGEVERLIAGHENAGSFMGVPAWERADKAFGSAPSLVGQSFGRYRLLSVLGTGGSGTVYLAEDTRLERRIALKLLPAQLFHEPEHGRRFEQEIRAISALNHPNIVAVYDTGEIDAGRFIVMELVAGRTVRALQGERLPLAAHLQVIGQVAHALAAAHAAGIVHRDIKPENVMVRDDGYAKVLDFGLARLLGRGGPASGPSTAVRTESGALLGTLPYMSPEQVRGEPVTAATDIFSLGTVFYELTTGRHPFAAASQFGVLHRILSESPLSPAQVNPHISAPLASLMVQMLEKDAHLRPAALEVVRSLDDMSTRAFSVMAVRPRLSTGGPASDQTEANRYFENAMQLKVNLDVPRCRTLLERAVELDPHFAEARAWYGFTNWLMLDGGYTNDGAVLYQAEGEMRRALRDDPGLARAHAFLAPIYLSQGRKELMPASIDRALKVSPFDEDALQWSMHYHHYCGDYRTAQAIAQQVLGRLPLFFPARMILGDMLRQQGDLTGAARELERILEQDAHNAYAIRFLARAHIDAGDLAAARQTLERARATDRESYWARLLKAILLSLEGDIGGALSEVDEDVLKWGSVAGHLTSEIAVFYSVSDDVPAALLWLDRAVRHGDERGDYFARDPLLATVRLDPRFGQILESIRHRSSSRQVVS